MRIEQMVILTTVIFLMTLAIACEYARYKECRKIHPVWYCTSGNR